MSWYHETPADQRRAFRARALVRHDADVVECDSDSDAHAYVHAFIGDAFVSSGLADALVQLRAARPRS